MRVAWVCWWFLLSFSIRSIQAFASLSRSSRRRAAVFLQRRLVGPPSFSSLHSAKDSKDAATATAASDTRPMTTTTNTTTPKARRVADIAACGQRLRNGGLVAVPTETVYGLGGDARNFAACEHIFRAKERPHTDPLIVHVLTAEDAYEFWAAFADNENDDSTDHASDRLAASILRRLTQASPWWPGPLTLVARARKSVPSILTAGTGFVACRSPAHRICRRVLQASGGVPMAAPSANKFGHVSPTTAQHVWDDLQDEDVWILDPNHDDEKEQDDESHDNTNVGVESTVAKLTIENSNSDNGTPQAVLTVLRQGAVAAADLQNFFLSNNIPNVRVEQCLRQKANDQTPQVAPGQTIRHYAPNIPSFMLAPELLRDAKNTETHNIDWSTTVLMDFGGRLPQTWTTMCLAVRDLSPTGDSAVAARHIFATLRWAERVPGATRVLFPTIVVDVDNNAENADNANSHDNIQSNALALALQDRLTRAASGVVLHKLSDL